MMEMNTVEFRERKKKRNTVDLPEDLIVEILSRVPEASLARFRSISKGWNALIKKEERLAKKSQILMLIDSRVYLASSDLRGIHDSVVKLTTSQFSLKDPLSESSEEVDISNVFHCDGLLLCTIKDKRLVVWNPRSGETSWIKPRTSYKDSDIYAIGKSSCNKYKILRMYENSDIFAVKLEIYDFTSNSWRSIVNTTELWWIRPMWRRGTSVSGNTYWLAAQSVIVKLSPHSPSQTSRDGRVSLPHGKTLLSFDFAKERFERVSLPGNPLYYHVCGLSVTREEQQLCVLTTQSRVGFSTVDLWRATKIKNIVSKKKKTKIDESTKGASWRKFLSVKTVYLHHQTFDLSCWKANFLADRENKVLVCRGEYLSAKSSFIHIVEEEGKCIKVDHDDAGSECSLLVNYVPSLVQIQ